MMENWKTNMYRLIGCYSGVAMAFLFVMYGILSGNRGETGDVLYVNFCNTFHSILTFATFFYLLICASRIMEVMNTKNKRIPYMMLPATNGEKFISRVIYVCITSMVILFIGLFFAELTRLALLPLFDAPKEFSHFCLLDIINKTDLSYYELFSYSGHEFTFMILFWTSINLWNHSIYILGGTYFRKHPFVKTWGIMMALFVIVAYIFGTIVTRKLFLYFDTTDKSLWINVNTVSIVFLILTVINWALSYHLFKNSQIIDRKLFRK